MRFVGFSECAGVSAAFHAVSTVVFRLLGGEPPDLAAVSDLEDEPPRPCEAVVGVGQTPPDQPRTGKTLGSAFLGREMAFQRRVTTTPSC